MRTPQCAQPSFHCPYYSIHIISTWSRRSRKFTTHSLLSESHFILEHFACKEGRVLKSQWLVPVSSHWRQESDSQLVHDLIHERGTYELGTITRGVWIQGCLCAEIHDAKDIEIDLESGTELFGKMWKEWDLIQLMSSPNRKNPKVKYMPCADGKEPLKTL
jgi:hypothetical protein